MCTAQVNQHHSSQPARRRDELQPDIWCVRREPAQKYETLSAPTPKVALETNEQTVLKITAVLAPECSRPARILDPIASKLSWCFDRVQHRNVVLSRMTKLKTKSASVKREESTADRFQPIIAGSRCPSSLSKATVDLLADSLRLGVEHAGHPPAQRERARDRRPIAHKGIEAKNSTTPRTSASCGHGWASPVRRRAGGRRMSHYCVSRRHRRCREGDHR